MHKAVFDTNVYISAILGGKTCKTLLEIALCGREISLFISEPILNELHEKLISKFKFESRELIVILKEILFHAQLIDPSHSVNVSEDPDDNKIVNCALSAKTDFVVSGDRHLKEIKQYRKIKFLSPAEFLALIKGENGDG